ncbi:DUF6517 family protein [Halopelagius longus]|uniref:Uncharacterized protein n=1 Tax=Halopelagius longus TaxID=1236180 RepID=A0A1H0XVB4_9EURY|nr:DUF6517 family protein [Halopelagius longus]RDI72114.1 hypothetical protein DWB78_10535 [Halopelagius longus]SDQ06864.1 hypothetical protein SAMN05216278_0215 [Halopelagius longus]
MHPGNERNETDGSGNEGREGWSRRAYLGVAAAAGASALAGCSGQGSTVSAARRPPKVPEGRLDEGGWEQTDDVTDDPAFEQSVGPMTLTAATRTLLYEDTALRERIAEQTLGRADAQLATFFATRATFDPDITSLPAGAGRQQLLDRVESQSQQAFQSRLKQAGLTDVTKTSEETMQVASGAEARLTNFEATYAFDGFSVDLGDRKIAIEGGEITVAGHLAAWIGDGSVLVTGGAYPDENFEREVTKSPSEAISLTVDVDLGLEPETYRDELFGLMKRVR